MDENTSKGRVLYICRPMQNENKATINNQNSSAAQGFAAQTTGRPAGVRRQTPSEKKFCTLSPAIRAKIDAAAKRYIRRKDRLEHPDGSFDDAGRWYPDPSEQLDTSAYRTPSRAYPYSYLLPCRSAAHCARMEGVEEYASIVRWRAKIIKALLILMGAKP